MCNICEGNELLDAECLEMKIDGNKLKLDYEAYSCDSSFNEEMEIKFCMNCGRKLKEEIKMQPHQQRVVDEKTALDEKATALGNFIGANPIFEAIDPAEQERLKAQVNVMWQYSMILGERIAAFTTVG